MWGLWCLWVCAVLHASFFRVDDAGSRLLQMMVPCCWITHCQFPEDWLLAVKLAHGWTSTWNSYHNNGKTFRIWWHFWNLWTFLPWELPPLLHHSMVSPSLLSAFSLSYPHPVFLCPPVLPPSSVTCVFEVPHMQYYYDILKFSCCFASCNVTC